MAIKEIQLMPQEEYDRGQKVRMQLDQMVNHLNNLPVPMSLVWLWAWDLIRDKFNMYSDIGTDDYVITPGTTLDVIWDKLWANPPSDFTLEYGAEQMDEAVTDWMIENEFIALLEDDGWLDDVADLEEANI